MSESSPPSRRRNSYLIALAGLVVAGWAWMAVVDWFDKPQTPLNAVFAIMTMGTAFGHALLAGAWCPLGPLALSQRLPLSVAWLSVSAFALAAGLVWAAGQGALVVTLIFGGVMLTQWFLAQMALWPLAVWLRLSIARNDDFQASASSLYQFALRDLLLLTSFGAVVMGVGRIVLERTATDA